MDNSPDTNADDATALVVFGMDDSRKPHASRFSEEEAELAEKAAGLMGMHVFRPATDENRTLAANLPRGRVFASGKAFLPFVKADLYVALSGAAGLSATDAAEPRQRPPAATLGGPEAMPVGTPATTFADIGPGSLVLAHDDDHYAWFEALVLKVSEDRATLVWPDYPDHGKILRRIGELGLLPGPHQSA